MPQESCFLQPDIITFLLTGTDAFEDLDSDPAPKAEETINDPPDCPEDEPDCCSPDFCPAGGPLCEGVPCTRPACDPESGYGCGSPLCKRNEVMCDEEEVETQQVEQAAEEEELRKVDEERVEAEIQEEEEQRQAAEEAAAEAAAEEEAAAEAEEDSDKTKAEATTGKKIYC